MTLTATSEAYWKAYSHSDIAIELKFNRSKLLDVLEQTTLQYNVFIGKVEYMKTESITRKISRIPFSPQITPNFNNPLFNARLLLLKRNAFKYEDEIRIIIVKKDSSQEKGIFIPYNCPNTDLISSITLDPRLGSNTINLLKSVFENQYKFQPISTSKGKRYRVLRSHIYFQITPKKITI